MNVERLGAADYEAWDAYLQTEPAGLFFYSTKYRRLLTGLLGCEEHYLVARDGGEIRGVLPLLGWDGPYGRVWNSLPYYGSHGGVLAASEEAAAALVAAYRELVAGALGGTVVDNPLQEQPAHDAIPGNLADERIGQFTDIAIAADHEQALLERVETRARGSIRKATSEGIEVEIDAGALPWLASIHRENMLAVGAPPKDARFFELVAEIFEPGEEYDVYVARRGDELLAAALLFYFNGVVEYFTPALAHEARPLQALSLVLFRALVDSSQRGFRLWNWGSRQAHQHGVYLFKRQWDTFDRPYRYRVQLNDDSLLDEATPAALLAGYPSFYVVPFSALAASASVG